MNLSYQTESFTINSSDIQNQIARTKIESSWWRADCPWEKPLVHRCTPTYYEASIQLEQLLSVDALAKKQIETLTSLHTAYVISVEVRTDGSSRNWSQFQDFLNILLKKEATDSVMKMQVYIKGSLIVASGIPLDGEYSFKCPKKHTDATLYIVKEEQPTPYKLEIQYFGTSVQGYRQWKFQINDIPLKELDGKQIIFNAYEKVVFNSDEHGTLKIREEEEDYTHTAIADLNNLEKGIGFK